MTPDQIAAITDPIARAKEAEGYLRRVRTSADTVQTIRAGAITELLTAGWSVRKVATEVGLSASRVQQVKDTTKQNGSKT